MQPAAYSYIRMSTDMQLKGDSLRRQKEASATYAAANNLTLAEDFSLEDIGRSAFKGDHVSQGALGLFLREIEEGKIERGSYLLVESLDRLSREAVEHAAMQFFGILKAGVNIVTLADNRVYLAGKTEFSDIIYSIVVMARAHEESKMKSVRLGAAWENKRRNAMSGKLTRIAPAWLKLSSDRRTFEIVEDLAKIVRSIYDQADSGKGSMQITRDLNLSNSPTIGRSAGWHQSYVTKLLTNRAVIGEYQPHMLVEGKRMPVGDAIVDYFPAIVSVEQFDRVQVGRGKRRISGAGRKGRSYTNLFSGIAKCGYCGGRIHVFNKGPGPKGGTYLRCDNSARGISCSSSAWNLSHFETSFMYFVRELDLESVFSDGRVDEERREIERRITAVQGEKDRHIAARDRAFDLVSDPSIDTVFIGGKIRQLSEAIDSANAELHDLARKLVEISSRQVPSEIEIGLLIERLKNHADVDARTKAANWIRLHVKELLLYSDGIDPEIDRDKLRSFSVLFETGVFRTVTLDKTDPKKHSFSVHADADGWREE